MKKIGVITLYGNSNMGNKLQHYAVMQLYQSLGYSAVAVNHMERDLLSRRMLLMNGIKGVLLRINPDFRRLQTYKRYLQRRRLFLDFTEHYLTPSETVSIKFLPKDLKERYDFFSVGSDQVWFGPKKPKGHHFFFLKFADRQQRICFSPSFGLGSVPEDETAVYRDGLNGFRCLSCREASGVELIRALTGRDAVLLSDPTVALPATDWARLEKKPSYSLPEHYVLSYMLGSVRPETRDGVSHYAALLDADVVNINDTKNETEYYAATGPREFLYLIRHALLVCTNSFHGTLFSILFRSHFVCFERDDAVTVGDMSNRITTLLEKFHLASRRHGCLSDDELLSADYTGVEETLSLERERILEYLRESVGDNGKS